MTMLLKRISVYDIPPFELREADRMECLAAGITPELAVLRSVQASSNAFANYANGELLCLWGFRFEDSRGREARMWLLSTPAVERYKTHFARTSQRMVKILLDEAPVIKVLVHTEHKLAVRWLKWLGFEIVEHHNEQFMTMRKSR